MIGAILSAAAPMLNPGLANETPQMKMFVSGSCCPHSLTPPPQLEDGQSGLDPNERSRESIEGKRADLPLLVLPLVRVAFGLI
jgi:hypothetical protein